MIKCSKCGAELSDDTKFCSYCGNKIDATPPHPTEEEFVPFETSHPETAWSNVDKVDAPKSLADKIKDKAADKWRNLSTYGKITTVAMSAFVLLCLVALLFGKTAAAIIAILQIVLTVVAVLMKKQVIKVSQSWLHIVALVLAVILLVPYVSLIGINYDKDDSKMNISVNTSEEYGTLVWSDSTIACLLPIPKSATGKIAQDDEKGFTAYVSNTQIEEFNAYVAACADKGFSVDTSKSDKSYSAKNSDGYQLSVLYQENDIMSISVDEPEYAVSLEIECVENLLFSKYDVDVYVDDSMQGTTNHGTTKTHNLSLPKGIYEIKFVNVNDDEVMGTVTIDIHQNEALKYKISCTSSQINVETITGAVSENQTEPQKTKKRITMPHSTSDYIGSDWTIETITKHFEELGFTNIRAVPCEPDDDNYKINIREMVISKGLFSTDPWEAGEEFDADAEISIYYNEFPILTIDNCADLVTVLTSKNMDYMTFCEKYDGRYVEFDAYVIDHLTYSGGTSHIIDVSGGDYDGETEIDAYKPETYAGLNIRIGNRTWDNSINENVQVGDNVTVSGRIDTSWAEYFKCLYIETMHLNKR